MATKPPTAEALSLSAASFTGQIQSWIPADFGLDQASSSSSKPSGGLADSFQTDFERSERLGLGHPSLLIPAQKRRAEASSCSGAGNAALEKMMKVGKGKEKDETVWRKEDEGEEEEGESRGRIGKKRKVERVDLLLGKKKAKAKKSPTVAAKTGTSQPAETSKDDDEDPEPSTPANDESPEATQTPDDGEDTEDHTQADKDGKADTTSSATKPGPGANLLTKNQRKKMKKKQKKLAQENSQ
jgi:hypothetical protein